MGWARLPGDDGTSEDRDQVDLGTLSAELLVVVDHTMRPTATSLWLRPSAADSVPSAPLARSRPD